MFKSSSEPRLQTGFAIVLGGLALTAAAFYALQNNGVLPGGEVAGVKLAWLMCAVLFWYLLPGLLLLDSRMSKVARLAVVVLLANMLVRAVVELFMMYVTSNWHPWLGIGHDIFSFLLMLIVTLPVLGEANRLYAGYLGVATGMFIPEALFAWYMLENVSVPGVAVYFVPDDPAHSGVLLVTAVCVAMLLLYLVFFSGRWLYGKTKR